MATAPYGGAGSASAYGFSEAAAGNFDPASRGLPQHISSNFATEPGAFPTLSGNRPDDSTLGTSIPQHGGTMQNDVCAGSDPLAGFAGTMYQPQSYLVDSRMDYQTGAGALGPSASAYTDAQRPFPQIGAGTSTNPDDGRGQARLQEDLRAGSRFAAEYGAAPAARYASEPNAAVRYINEPAVVSAARYTGEPSAVSASRYAGESPVAQEPVRDFVARRPPDGMTAEDYCHAQRIVPDGRSCVGAGEYKHRADYRENAMQPCREPLEYALGHEASRPCYTFPRDGSFVAEAYAEGAPLHDRSHKSYPSGPSYLGRYGGPFSQAYGGDVAGFEGRGGYGARDPGYGCSYPSAYGVGQTPAYAYGSNHNPAVPDGGMNIGRSAANGYPYCGGGISSVNSRGDTYTGGRFSYGPAPGQEYVPGPYSGFYDAAYGMPNAAQLGYGSSAFASNPYNFPTAGSFVAEPFTSGPPNASLTQSCSRPCNYTAANHYGPGCGPAPPLPPNQSFLAMPDPPGAFAGIGGGWPGGGTAGGCPNFLQGATSSYDGGVRFGGSTAPLLPESAAGVSGKPVDSISASLDQATSALEGTGAAKLLGGTATSEITGQTKPPDRPPFKSTKPPKPEMARSKKKTSKFGCC